MLISQLQEPASRNPEEERCQLSSRTSPVTFYPYLVDVVLYLMDLRLLCAQWLDQPLLLIPCHYPPRLIAQVSSRSSPTRCLLDQDMDMEVTMNLMYSFKVCSWMPVLNCDYYIVAFKIYLSLSVVLKVTFS